MTDATSEAVGGWMERYRLHFIAGIALCGVLITLLSFAPWVEFRSIDAEGVTPTAPKAEVTIAGTSLSRWRDGENLLRNDVENVDGWCSCRVSFGDGYLTAGLGVLIVGFAGAAFVSRRDRMFAMAAVSASVVALGFAGYNGLAEWNAYVWTNLQHLEVTKGTVQPGLYLLIVDSMIAAVASGLLLGAGAEEVHEEVLLEAAGWDDGSREAVDRDSLYST